MSLNPAPFPELPPDTARAAHRAYRKGNLYVTLGDQVGSLWSDEELRTLYALDGAPGFSPGQLLMVLIFQALENLSDREAAEQVRGRIDWKYALHLSLDDAGFDFSVLSEFRDRLIAHQMGLGLLDRILERLRALGLLKEGRQRTDSTYVLQAPRVLNRLELVLESVRWVLEDLATTFPDWLGPIAQGHWLARYALGWHALRLPRSREAREKLAEEIGQDGRYLLAQIRAEGSPKEIQERESVQRLAAIWEQQYEAESGQWRRKGNLPEAKELIRTPHDPEARYSQHGEHDWEGYTLHVTETCDPEAPRLITQIAATLAPQADVQALPAIQESLVERGYAPQEQLVDQGYMALHLMQESDQRGIDLVGKVLDNTTWQGRQQGFGPERFDIDWEHKQAVCPEKQHAQVWSESHNSYGRPIVHIRFSQKACAACTSRARCTRGKQGRALKLSADYPALVQARARQKSEAFKVVYAQRPGIEGTLSHAVSQHGARRCRYIGMRKTQLQAVLMAAAINLERAARWLVGERPARTRVSHLSQLPMPASACASA